MIRHPLLVERFGSEAKGSLATKFDLDSLAIGGQVWLAPVQAVADLPVITDMSKSYLCRVIQENADYQCVQGQTAWALFSTSAEYATEGDIVEALGVHNSGTSTHADIRALLADCINVTGMSWVN
jgi:hypothetical protein